MFKKIIYGAIVVFMLTKFVWAASTVRIKSISGEVQIRRGVEETWHPASAGTWLEEIDTILTGERAEVILEIEPGKIFRLGGHAILDIADLRKITEQELFLSLMAKKVQKIERSAQKTKLRIGKVNVVHGALKKDSLDRAENNGESEGWKLEKNGALALFQQNYIPNAILKMNNIFTKYLIVNDCGEIHYYLGEAFETLHKPGQALDAYQSVIKESLTENCKMPGNRIWVKEAESAIKRLKP
ncbi:MAG: hypothetical protein ACE5HI_16145 [bacterium]